MKAFLTILGILFLAVAVFVGWRFFSYLKSSHEASESIDAVILPVVSKLKNKEFVSPGEIQRFAQRLDTRSEFFRALVEIKKQELFPKEYASLEKIAESDMAAWLLFPTELGVLPDEIVLTKEIKRGEGAPSRPCRYFIFKFRTHPPHWAAKDGWMAGVAGPYFSDWKSEESPSMVFSRFEAYDSATPEEHLNKTLETLQKVAQKQFQ